MTRTQPPGARLDGDGNRLWTWTGRGFVEEFFSVTTIIGGGVPKHLNAHYAKLVAELAYADVERHGKRALRRWATAGRRYLAELRADGMKLDKADETPKGLGLRWLKGAPDRHRDAAGDRGQTIHDAAEGFVLQYAREGARMYAATGVVPPEDPAWPEEIVPYMRGFLAFLVDHRPVYLATEARIYSRSRTYAGKTDAFLRIPIPDELAGIETVEPGWLTLCPDYKSGREIYHEVALQTSAYRRGDFIGLPDNVTEAPIPPTDAGAVLHLLPKPRADAPRGYVFRLLGPRPGSVERAAWEERTFRTFLYAREIFGWVQRENGPRAGRTWLGETLGQDLGDALAASIEAQGAA